jgi:3-phosphoshikimate 1-carboxyvinyltransferase
MDKIFYNNAVRSEIRAISSKSEAHRYLICAAIGDRECEIICTDTNADIDATVACLNALGAEILRTENGFFVKPIAKIHKNQPLFCNESGSTLRFLLPLAASLGADCSFHMRGRLSERPLSPLYEILENNGVSLSQQGSNPLTIKGRFCAGNYRVKANVSSQFISGLLFALSVSVGESTLTLEGKIESEPYIWMTVNALNTFGASIIYNNEENSFKIVGRPRLHSTDKVIVSGDWSNAAFFLVAGTIGNDPVTLCGLDEGSRQGDKEILPLLEKMGAKILREDGKITIFPSKLHGVDINAENIPDLVPILAVAAATAEGETKISGAARLRLKESDRIESVCRTLSALGADIKETEDGMIIRGQKTLCGGEVDSFNDHRIAMSAAIASLVCKNAVKITRFEAINKSYPSFAENFIDSQR